MKTSDSRYCSGLAAGCAHEQGAWARVTAPATGATMASPRSAVSTSAGAGDAVGPAAKEIVFTAGAPPLRVDPNGDFESSRCTYST